MAGEGDIETSPERSIWKCRTAAECMRSAIAITAREDTRLEKWEDDCRGLARGNWLRLDGQAYWYHVEVGSGESEEHAEEVCGDFGGVLKEDEEMRFKIGRLNRTLQKTKRTDTYR